MSDPRPLALVTGASRGIGYELAQQFAAGGYDLVVTAEDDELLNAAERLRASGTAVHAVQADLRVVEGVERVHDAVLSAGRPLDAVALNAGIGQGGAFVDQELSQVLSVVDLDVRSTVHLAHLLLREMVARGQGRVLVTSSIASTMPGSFQAVYNASKSFLQSFTEALQEELKDSGVALTSLMPGPTDTEFFDRAQMGNTLMGKGPKDDPADVARQGFDALMAGKPKVVAASLMTKAQEAVTSVLPDRVKAAAHKQMAEPRGE